MNVMLTHEFIESNVLLNECKSVDNLATVAAKIAYYNFKWHYTTLVLINSTIICGVNALMTSYPNSMVVIDDLTASTKDRKTRQFVLFGYNLENIRILLKWIEKHKFDNTGSFLVICQSDEKIECDVIEAITILWEHRVINVIFMNLSHKGTGYTYDIGESCEGGPPVVVKNWDACFRLGKHCGNKFPMKLTNFNGCPITVSTFIQEPYMEINDGVPSGADGDLVRILVKALNASLIVKTPWKGGGWGNLDRNGSWVGSLGDLYYDLANISMTSASITNTRIKEFQMSRYYFHLKLVWVTHPSLMEAPTFKVMRPFKSDSRTALGIFFVVFLLVIFILKTIFRTSYFKRKKIKGMPNNTLFHSIEMCMGQPIAMRTMKTKVLSFILIWILYCFLIRTFYQVYLINSLKTDVYEKNLNTIEDAVREKYNFGGGLALSDYYADKPEIYNNWKEVNSSEYFKMMFNLTRGQKFVLAMNLATTQCFLKRPGRFLHVLPQNILTSPTILFFKKYSPLVPPINRILTYLVECGIPEMLYKNATMTKFVYRPPTTDKAIKLEDFAGCFFIVIFGWLISFLILVAEICLKKLKNICYIV